MAVAVMRLPPVLQSGGPGGEVITEWRPYGTGHTGLGASFTDSEYFLEGPTKPFVSPPWPG